MAFCKFSSEYVSKTYTIVDNIFFTRYLPTTPPKVATIYLYGLYLCNNNAQDLTGANLSSFASTLGYTEEEVMDAFRYWEEQGLVRIVNTTPLGMYPHVDTLPDIPYALLTLDYVCFDLVYNPETTRFLHEASRNGAATRNGLEMLILQALESWRIWNM